MHKDIKQKDYPKVRLPTPTYIKTEMKMKNVPTLKTEMTYVV